MVNIYQKKKFAIKLKESFKKKKKIYFWSKQRKTEKKKYLGFDSTTLHLKAHDRSQFAFQIPHL